MPTQYRIGIIGHTGRGDYGHAVDVAFRLPFDRPARAADAPIEIGVNVSGLLFNGGYTGGNEFGLQVDYADLMRRFIA